MRTSSLLTLLTLLVLAGCVSSDDDDSAATPAPRVTCAFWDAPAVLANVADPDLREISGLVVSRRDPSVLWVHEDSGAGPVLTALARDGRTLGTVTLDGSSAVDNEDLAVGPCPESPSGCLVLADFGDNAEIRIRATLRRIPEPDLSGLATPFALTVTPQRLDYTYPEGPQNAETLAITPDGEPVVVTKRNDGLARIYRLPSAWSGAEVEATLLSTVTMDPAGGLLNQVTGGDLSPDGDRLLLRTYGFVTELDLFDGGLRGAAVAPTRVLPSGAEPQGEAVAYDEDGLSVLQVGEASNPPLYRLQCGATR